MPPSHATFGTQVGALLRKNAVAQRRAWRTNLALLLVPVALCVLLFVLDKVIVKAFDTPENSCGCMCTLCCLPASRGGACRAANASSPCTGLESCSTYDENRCGLEFSDPTQALFCAVESPSSWPALQQMPRAPARAEPWKPQAGVPFTGKDEAVATELMNGIWTVPRPTSAQRTAAGVMVQEGAALGAFYAASLSLLGLDLSTPKTRDFYSFYLDPAFLSGSYGSGGGSSAGNANSGGGGGMGDGVDDDGQSVNPNATSISQLYATVSDIQALGLNLTLAGIAESVNQAANAALGTDVRLTMPPVQMDTAWYPDVDTLNRALYCAYRQAQCQEQPSTGQYSQAWDFGASSAENGALNYDVTLSFNATGRNRDQRLQILRVNWGLNAGSNAFVRLAVNGSAARTGAAAAAQPRPFRLLGLMEFPKPESSLFFNISNFLGPLFFTWIAQMLLPSTLVVLVTEKEKRLRTMMKMHGLGDAVYWAVQYSWFFCLTYLFCWVLIGIGSAVKLSFFTQTSYSLQAVFYFFWSNCLVAFAFLLSSAFASARTANVVAFLYTFATGLLGYLLLQQFIVAGHWWVVFLELVPGFALFRGLFEISAYAYRADYTGRGGLTWASLSDPGCGMTAVLVILAVEWVVFLVLAWYFEQIFAMGVGISRHPLFFLGYKHSSVPVPDSAAPPPYPSRLRRWSARARCWGRQERVASVMESASSTLGFEDVPSPRNRGLENGAAGSAYAPHPVRHETSAESAFKSVDSLGPGPEPSGPLPSTARELPREKPVKISLEPEDVAAERDAVESGRVGDACIVIRDLVKVFPAMGGNGPHAAVRGLSLAVGRGECFGLLGPNGAGKSTAINMLTGFLTPSAGTAWVEGYDIIADMQQVYSIMGVCPQHDLLWEDLTAREHLLFYGRLKQLKSSELSAAVDRALQSVNLFHNGVGDKRVKTYSGGMKRRLSVAISLMGSPRVVYMDEPSTGLDPASRQNLWDVVKRSKPGRGIILTTHSMEEAAALCDRLGIFVDGGLVCIGNPRELTARHGGYYVFSITVPPHELDRADALVAGFAPGARLTYSVGGTRKYELPAGEVTLADVFGTMSRAHAELNILDWAVANATLEEVFIKFARTTGVEGGN